MPEHPESGLPPSIVLQVQRCIEADQASTPLPDDDGDDAGDGAAHHDELNSNNLSQADPSMENEMEEAVPNREKGREVKICHTKFW